MQDRIVDSLKALSHSTSDTKGLGNPARKSDVEIRSKGSNLFGQLLGVVFWSIVGVSTWCGFAINGTAAQTIDPNNILLDFSSTHCMPCQQMSPIVSELERKGFPIRKVDINAEKELANRFNISSIPCFVLVANGREVKRVIGKTDERTLRAMMMELPKFSDDEGKGKNSNGNGAADTGTASSSGDRKLFPNTKAIVKNNDAKLIPTDSADTFRGQNPNSGNQNDRFTRSPLAASVRIKVNSGKYVNYGSGTIIDSEPGRSVVLTCGHVLRGLKKSDTIEVDFFSNGKSNPQTFAARPINSDAVTDLGLLEISSPLVLPVIKIGSANKPPAVNDQVVSVGCGGGKLPTVQKHSVTSLNRWEGPDSVECTGLPEQGRSGGGLFLGSELVGVCINADPKDERGIYTGLKHVVQILNKSKLGHLVPTLIPVDSIAVDTGSSKAKTIRNIGQSKNDDPLRVADSAIAELLQETSSGSANEKFDATDYVGAEIVCIVRPKTPGAMSRIVVVNQATSRFVDDLLRDTSGSVQPDPKTTVRTSPRTVPTDKSRAVKFAMSESSTDTESSWTDEIPDDEPNRRVETSLELRRTHEKKR